MAIPKITMKASVLYNALQTASHWVKKASINQTLQGVMIEHADGVLSITATDGLSTDITLYLEVASDGEFSVCVPAALLITKLQVYDSGNMEITISFGKVVTVRAGKHLSRLILLDKSLFPNVTRDFLEKAAAEGVSEIDPSEFIDAVGKIVGVSDPSSPYPAIGGVYLNKNDVVTIDGVKVALLSGTNLIEDTILVSGTTCSKIAKALAGIKRATMFVEEGYRLVVYWEGGVITTTLLQYDFPDYASIIPDEYSTEIELLREDLLTTMQLTTVEAREVENLVMLDFEEESLLVQAVSGVGTHQSEVSYISMAGEPIRIGMSMIYLIDALRKINNESYFILIYLI